MKIALVHDWLPTMGGAERVLSNFVELYPDAPIYTLICNHSKMEEPIKSSKIITSYLQKKNKECNNHRKLFPFMPTAIESFDLNEFDLVISSSSCVAKGVITNPNSVHICYCHSPMRYAWEFSYEYAGKMTGKSKIVKKLLNYFLTFMRVWDYSSAARVDYFIANSENVASCEIYSVLDVGCNGSWYFICATRSCKNASLSSAPPAFSAAALICSDAGVD